MTYVFIVSTGERGEGSSVVGVFTDESKATEVALSQEACFGEWAEPMLHQGEHKFTDYRGREVTIWWNGCDFVQVVRHQVQ